VKVFKVEETRERVGCTQKKRRRGKDAERLGWGLDPWQSSELGGDMGPGEVRKMAGEDEKKLDGREVQNRHKMFRCTWPYAGNYCNS
jgi:hypothetical protein